VSTFAPIEEFGFWPDELNSSGPTQKKNLDFGSSPDWVEADMHKSWTLAFSRSYRKSLKTDRKTGRKALK